MISKYATTAKVIAAIAAGVLIAFQGYTISNLRDKVQVLDSQVEQITDINQTLVRDLMGVKESVEGYFTAIHEINQESKRLSEFLNSPEFKERMKTDLDAATIEYNQLFNSYLEGISNATRN